MQRVLPRLLLAVVALALMAASSFAQSTPNKSNPCPRPAAGSTVLPPPDLFSRNGVLNVTFNYFTTVDSVGRTLFCFDTPNGIEAPTLHVNPGDTLNVTVTNQVPPPPAGSPTEVVSNRSNRCGDATMTQSSVNVHYHGTNTSPACHSDEVIHTIINSGETFKYSVHFPANEPPGLYWYHPHVHGLAEAAVQGGATGAIIVEGIANFALAVAGLPQRLLVIRDQPVANDTGASDEPAWDVSVNYVPVPFPDYTPAVIKMKAGQKEFWRVANTAAGTILDVQLQYDGVAQPLKIVALDGVPIGSQDGTTHGSILTQTDILIPPAGRAEFIVTGPSSAVASARLVTLNVDTGPDGDNDPARPLAAIHASSAPPALAATPGATASSGASMFPNLASEKPTATRTLYFSENNPAHQFFITADGATPVLFDPNLPPAITTTQGSVEDWTIQNRSFENHEFHMHQIHFLLLAVNGAPVPKSQQQFFDMHDIPFWSGSGPYPSITVRMDFRGQDIGDFVYHCHILEHEDAGMMAIIRVLPPPS